MLDLCRRDTICGPDVFTSRTVPRADGLGATVVGLRRHADHECRPCPNIVAGDIRVVFLDIAGYERKLGLDALAIE